MFVESYVFIAIRSLIVYCVSVYSSFHQHDNYLMLSILCFCVWPDIVLILLLHITWNSSKHKSHHWELIFSATGGIGSNGCARTDLGSRAGRLTFNLWIPETNVMQNSVNLLNSNATMYSLYKTICQWKKVHNCTLRVSSTFQYCLSAKHTSACSFNNNPYKPLFFMKAFM